MTDGLLAPSSTSVVIVIHGHTHTGPRKIFSVQATPSRCDCVFDCQNNMIRGSFTHVDDTGEQRVDMEAPTLLVNQVYLARKEKVRCCFGKESQDRACNLVRHAKVCFFFGEPGLVLCRLPSFAWRGEGDRETGRQDLCRIVGRFLCVVSGVLLLGTFRIKLHLRTLVMRRRGRPASAVPNVSSATVAHTVQKMRSDRCNSCRGGRRCGLLSSGVGGHCGVLEPVVVSLFLSWKRSLSSMWSPSIRARINASLHQETPCLSLSWFTAQFGSHSAHHHPFRSNI